MCGRFTFQHRMPVVLARDLEAAWLDPARTKAPDGLDLWSRRTGLKLDAYPMSRLVNKPSIDSHALIQRVESHGLRDAAAQVDSRGNSRT